MPQLNRLSHCSAITFWNNFLTSYTSIVPFSYNPSLFDFYVEYFHWRPYYFLIFDKNKAAGLLPLVNTGKAWVSLPHFSYGGFTGIDNYNYKFNEEIIQKLIFLIKNEKHNYGFFQCDLKTIIHNQAANKRLFVRNINKNSDKNSYNKISSIIFLPETNKELFENLNANMRRKINKASHSEFSIQIGGEELLDLFYSLYSKKMYELGSLAYERNFFKTLLETYHFGEAKFFLLRQQGKAVGTALLLSYHGFYESTWFATNKTAYKNYVSDFLHWQMLKYAIEKKASVYSFGRSTLQGSVYKYKSHWPVIDIPIYQNKKTFIRSQKWLSSVWKKVPYFISKPIGSQLVRHIY